MRIRNRPAASRPEGFESENLKRVAMRSRPVGSGRPLNPAAGDLSSRPTRVRAGHPHPHAGGLCHRPRPLPSPGGPRDFPASTHALQLHAAAPNSPRGHKDRAPGRGGLRAPGRARPEASSPGPRPRRARPRAPAPHLPGCAASGRPGAEPSALAVPPSRRRGRAPAFPP